MVDKVRDYIEKNQMITKGDTIILGISGGADSVCLFFVLLALKETYNLNLVAVHVNHNLRGEDAKRDQEYVEDLCREYQVECIVVSVDVQEEAEKRKKSLEETGREVRQEAFARVAQGRDGEVKIATAHHGNDNVETFLMNLVRGTGITGLNGIAPVRGNYIRPLLCVKRSEIEKYLEENKKKFCIDWTNHENIYIRNVIRNEVIPTLESGVNAQAVAHIEAAMEELKKVEAYLQEQVEGCWRESVEESESQVDICKDTLLLQPELLQEKLVKRALECVAKQQRDISRIHVAQVLDMLHRQVGREIHLPYEMKALRTYEGIRIYRSIRMNEDAISKDKGKETWGVKFQVISREDFQREEGKAGEFPDSPYTKYFDYDIMEAIPSVRTRLEGDYIVINTSGNRQTLKKYYTTNKIPANIRGEIPLVTSGQEVLWIIGYRRCSGYEITATTQKILKVEYNGGNHGREY